MILRKLLIASFSMVVGLLVVGAGAWAEKASVNPRVYGSWEAIKLEQSGMTIVGVIVIEKSQVASTVTCSIGESRVVVEVSSPAVITADTIQVLESKYLEKEYSPGFLKCSSSLSPQTIKYQVRNGKLAITDPDTKETKELPRASR